MLTQVSGRVDFYTHHGHVEWHLREAWRELLFSDPFAEQIRGQRNALQPVPRSKEAERKVATQQLQDGSIAYCFRTLIEHLETVTVNRCRVRGSTDDSAPFELTATLNDKQQRALELIRTIDYPRKKKQL